ncbi:CBS domain-containing protein CBSCBSPB1-like protein [Tanacetum coccineum]
MSSQSGDGEFWSDADFDFGYHDNSKRIKKQEDICAKIYAIFRDCNSEDVGKGIGQWEPELVAIATNLMDIQEWRPFWVYRPWKSSTLTVQASPSQFAQMKVFVAILGSYGWSRFTFIYEDINSESAQVILFLMEAIKETSTRDEDHFDSIVSDFIYLPWKFAHDQANKRTNLTDEDGDSCTPSLTIAAGEIFLVILATNSDLAAAVEHARSAGWKGLKLHLDYSGMPKTQKGLSAAASGGGLEHAHPDAWASAYNSVAAGAALVAGLVREFSSEVGHLLCYFTGTERVISFEVFLLVMRKKFLALVKNPHIDAVNGIAFAHSNMQLSIVTCGDDKTIKVLVLSLYIDTQPKEKTVEKKAPAKNIVAKPKAAPKEKEIANPKSFAKARPTTKQRLLLSLLLSQK